MRLKNFSISRQKLQWKYRKLESKGGNKRKIRTNKKIKHRDQQKDQKRMKYINKLSQEYY